MQGTVIRFSDIRGYGFIHGEDDCDYFVHQSKINMLGYRSLIPGEKVEFDPVHTDRGNQAFNVTLLRAVPRAQPILTDEASTEVVLRKNPFTPQDPIVDPSKFAGRKSEAIRALRYLFDGANILIQGPRGIGKSSFAHQLLQVKKGNFDFLDRNRIKISTRENSSTICWYGCSSGDNLSDIANGLIKSLTFELTGKVNVSDTIDTKVLNLGDIQKQITTTTKNLSLTEVANDFSLIVRRMCSENGSFSGITFLIDEIDVLNKDISIAPFLKIVCENFSRSTDFNYLFILCGVTGTITRLIREHKSSSRLFQPIDLTQFTKEEIIDLIDITLAESGVTMAEEAKSRIVYLSNRFPHPAQLLGYHAFINCSGNIISYDDVLYSQNMIVQTIKEQEFLTKWTKHKESIQSQILQIIAVDSDDTFTYDTIKKQISTLSKDQIIGAISNLLREEIVDRVSSGSQRFAFREPLFKIYLQWIYQDV